MVVGKHSTQRPVSVVVLTRRPETSLEGIRIPALDGGLRSTPRLIVPVAIGCARVTWGNLRGRRLRRLKRLRAAGARRPRSSLGIDGRVARLHFFGAERAVLIVKSIGRAI